jgi:hypothetical protein
VRLIAALAFFLVLWLAAWWSILPLSVFIGMVVAHVRIAESKRQAMKAVAFYEMGIARIEDRWIGKGQSTEILRDETHLYAADLDVFGSCVPRALAAARRRWPHGWLPRPPSRRSGNVSRALRSFGLGSTSGRGWRLLAPTSGPACI